MTELIPVPDRLVDDLRHLILEARENAAVAINSELTGLYWRIGKRIQVEVLGSARASYGEQIVSAVGRQLTTDCGRGFAAKSLRHMMRFAQTFPDEQIVSALRRQLTWTHLKALIYIDDPLKRDFYIELCQLEGWSSRQLQERMQSLLYERSAVSKQPEATIRADLTALRQDEPPTPAMLLKDPYLDFLGLEDRYLEVYLEAAILREIEHFLLELGAGSTFVARQKRIQIDKTISILTCCSTTANSDAW